MDSEKRRKRLRLLIKRLNRQRKKQAKKIDILCNDFIDAHRSFIKRLDSISFTANFYRAILGTTDLNGLLYTACRLIEEEIADVKVAFFLRQEDNFELHMFENDQPIGSKGRSLENCFTAELVVNICKSNKLCTLDQLLAMGLEASPSWLNKISAVTIPLARLGPCPGFILMYRSSERQLIAGELNNITAITPGLSRAIQSCGMPSPSAG